ncbi:MAG: alanine:cation symporter family protein, partial [Bilophila wadsworthia]
MMAVRFGMARGIFANEAGLGSGPIAHATATSTPIRQATIGMLDVFITTMIVCSMTGFAILVTGEWTAVGAQGASLTARAFETALPGVGSAIVAISLVMFAFTTILGWCVYGERSAIFLFGDRVLKPFRILYTIVVPIGALAQLDQVWILADTINA